MLYDKSKTEVLDNNDNTYLKTLEDNFIKDIHLRHTSFGAHRDDYIFEFTDGFAPVLQNGKYGAVNTAGKIVVPIKYNSADDALYIAKKL